MNSKRFNEQTANFTVSPYGPLARRQCYHIPTPIKLRTKYSDFRRLHSQHSRHLSHDPQFIGVST